MGVNFGDTCVVQRHFENSATAIRDPVLTQNFDTRVAHRFAGGEPA